MLYLGILVIGGLFACLFGLLANNSYEIILDKIRDYKNKNYNELWRENEKNTAIENLFHVTSQLSSHNILHKDYESFMKNDVKNTAENIKTIAKNQCKILDNIQQADKHLEYLETLEYFKNMNERIASIADVDVYPVLKEKNAKLKWKNANEMAQSIEDEILKHAQDIAKIRQESETLHISTTSVKKINEVFNTVEEKEDSKTRIYDPRSYKLPKSIHKENL